MLAITTASAAASIARASLRLRSPCSARMAHISRGFTTYSGGQPSEGQGGFYGAIKSRSEKNAVFQPGSRAERKDVDALQRLMDHWDAERATLRTSSDEDAAWRALVTESDNNTLLARLVVKGAPVWGLSVEQREFVARFMSKTA